MRKSISVMMVLCMLIAGLAVLMPAANAATNGGVTFVRQNPQYDGWLYVPSETVTWELYGNLGTTDSHDYVLWEQSNVGDFTKKTFAWDDITLDNNGEGKISYELSADFADGTYTVVAYDDQAIENSGGTWYNSGDDAEMVIGLF